MPAYIVLTAAEVPASGTAANATAIYLGTHATEAAAVTAACDVLQPPVGQLMWAVPAGNLTRYLVSDRAMVYISAPG